MENDCHDCANDTKGRNGSQANNQRGQELVGHKRKENKDKVWISPLEDIDNGDPRHNVEKTSSGSNSMFFSSCLAEREDGVSRFRLEQVQSYLLSEHHLPSM